MMNQDEVTVVCYDDGRVDLHDRAGELLVRLEQVGRTPDAIRMLDAMSDELRTRRRADGILKDEIEAEMILLRHATMAMAFGDGGRA